MVKSVRVGSRVQKAGGPCDGPWGLVMELAGHAQQKQAYVLWDGQKDPVWVAASRVRLPRDPEEEEASHNEPKRAKRDQSESEEEDSNSEEDSTDSDDNDDPETAVALPKGGAVDTKVSQEDHEDIEDIVVVTR